MAEKLKSELAEIEDEIENNNHEMEIILGRQDQLKKKRQVIIDKLKSLEDISNEPCDLDSTDFPWSKKLDEAMKSVFKLEQLRPNQLQTMNATLNGRDVMLIMPTGGGKSLCFQLPAVISKGITIVVSPLISLMEDQVMALKSRGVKAEMISSGTKKEDLNNIMKEMTDPGTKLKLLYVTPERLAKSKRFMSKLQKTYELGLFGRLAVDEVHCCSQWGHDFRKDYKILGIFKRQFPNVPIIGLTATSTTRVTVDVQEMLNIQNCLIFRASFNRPNLFYKVLPKPSVQKEVSDELAKMIKSYGNKSGIVYCLTIKEAEEVSKQLKAYCIEAMPYHAQLTAELRSKIHRLWLMNKCQVVVATIAFGMGIDKPDVRFVIHFSLTRSIENYYQESGRAGRDNNPADCIMFYRFGDFFRQSCMVFTDTGGLEHLYVMGSYCIEQTRCRRMILADNFGEQWNDDKCDMCDICVQQPITGSVDITKYCKDIYQILDSASMSDQKLTALKLVDAWRGKKVSGFVMPKIAAVNFSQVLCERILVHLLLESYLKELFHFTPYNTISYILKGTKSSKVMDGSAVIQIKQVKSKPNIIPKTSSNPQIIKIKEDKPDVTKATTEKFRNRTASSSKSKKNISTKPTKTLEDSDSDFIPSKKRNAQEIVDVEDTDSDIDFGTWNSPTSRKKVKVSSD